MDEVAATEVANNYLVTVSVGSLGSTRLMSVAVEEDRFRHNQDNPPGYRDNMHATHTLHAELGSRKSRK